ncbi:MAG: efflux RND transporter periplasmic adaptor subunit [Wenzhouxiangellaceae bacterium]
MKSLFNADNRSLMMRWLALLILFAVGALWLSGGLAPRIAPGAVAIAADTLPADARTATVSAQRKPLYEWTSGTLQSASRTEISSRILARIDSVAVAAGDRVQAGDVLIRLDARQLQAQRQQRVDQRSAAQAERELARSEQQRAADLLQRGSGSQQAYDQASAGLRVAQARLDQAQRALEEAETALSYAVIEAPVSGVVIDRLAEPGDTAAPGVPLLRLYDPQRLRVEAAVRESLALALSTGDPLTVRIDALNLDLAGRIDEIVPYAEPGARTLLIKVALPANPKLMAGLYARLAIPAGERDYLMIPSSAVTQIGQLDFVTVISPNGHPQQRLITLGQSDEQNQQVEVLSGLTVDEEVVL